MSTCIEQAKNTLFERYESVDVYLTHAREWAVKVVNNDRDQHTVTDTSLSSAMSKALEYRFIPKYQRRPRLFRAESVRPQKSGSSEWRAMINQDDCGVRFKTKKAVIEWAERLEEKMHHATATWDETIAPELAGKVEGIDYQWKS